MTRFKSVLFATVALGISGCVTAQTGAAPEVELDPADACPSAVAAMFAPLVGDWTLAIQADEGWTGYGTSTIGWDADRPCALAEVSQSVFNQESDTPMETRATALLVFDQLSETVKTLTSDDRGYVHLGVARPLPRPATPMRFGILKGDGMPPTRQILYRAFGPEGFEWVWQGRADSAAPWVDRLVITYRRAP